AQSLTLVKDTALSVKGSQFGMSCILSVPFISGGIGFWKDGTELITCIGSSHLCVPNTNKANQTGVFMTISSLDRATHAGNWTCVSTQGNNRITSNSVNLIVY
ncbi:hypothetical protein ACJMK2_027395, partial [Sinanodonta woodiana]